MSTPTLERPLVIRDSTEADVPAIARIYRHWVTESLASYELEPPGEAEMARRRAAVLAGGYPYLVATDERDAVVGYAYAGPYRTRPAYRFTCEDSIYVAPGVTGRGAGRALLSGLITRCEDLGLRLMVAVIGDGSNAASIGLHAKLGFHQAGLLPGIGWKMDQWVDCVLMIRPLGAGKAAPPKERRA